MKKLILWTIEFIMIVGFIGCSSSQSQNSGGMGMMDSGKGINEFGNSGGGMPDYDKSSFMTTNVTVDKVGKSEFNQMNGGTGLHLYTTAQNGRSYTIHVAPQFYIDKKNIKFNVGEKLKVSGSYFTGGPTGGENIFAATIVYLKSNKTIQFRNPNTGNGVWMISDNSSMREKMMKKMKEKMRKR